MAISRRETLTEELELVGVDRRRLVGIASHKVSMADIVQVAPPLAFLANSNSEQIVRLMDARDSRECMRLGCHSNDRLPFIFYGLAPNLSLSHC